MNTFKRFAFIAFALTHAASALAGYDIQVRSIRFSFSSLDGYALPGVELATNLNGETLTVIDGTGFIPVPALPHWSRSGLDYDYLGKTDNSGTLTLEAKSYTSFSPLVRNAELHIFSNGTIPLCRTSAVMLPLDDECLAVLLDGEERDVVLNCKTKWTRAQVEREVMAAVAKCSR